MPRERLANDQDPETQYLERHERQQRRRLTASVFDIWLTVFVLTTLFIFVLLYNWKPVMLQYIGIDKRPTGVVRAPLAMLLASLLGALSASIVCLVVWKNTDLP